MHKRRAEILDLLSRDGQVSVQDLTERLSVSQVTIRGDLADLAEQGLLTRVHGGARAARPASGLLSHFESHLHAHAEQKQRIGAAAAAMVQDDEAIILDASTTALAIVPYLRNRRGLTVATYSLAVANALLGIPSINVLMHGGFLNRSTCSLWGGDLEFLSLFNFDRGFFGANGFTLDQGLTEPNLDEVRIKKQLVTCTSQVCAVIDSRKWNRIGFVSFVSTENLDCVITDDGAPPDMVAAVRNAGIQVVVV